MMDESVLKSDERAILRLRRLYADHGYSHFKMSKFEEYDLYVQNKNFLVSDQVITFTDTNGRLMALKPDVTLSIVKNTSAPTDSTQKLYYDENVYRISGKNNAYREIMQVGLECLGKIDAYCIGEVLSLAAKSLAQIGDTYVLNVSHLGILSEVIDAIGLSQRARSRVLACIGEKNLHGVEALCAAEGKTAAEIAPLRALITTYGAPHEVIAALAPILPTERARAMLTELGAILSVLACEQVKIDFSVVHDMNYYNGIVFCGYVDRIPARILSGGQYDRLMERMGKRAGAVGFAVYLDLLKGAEGTQDYDVDAVLLYDADTELSVLAQAAQALRAEGLCVAVQPALPEKLRYRRLYQMEKGVCKCLEANA